MNQPQVQVIQGNEVKPTIETLWAAIFGCGDIVVKHWKDFGFSGMHQPNPNIHQLILYVILLEGVIEAAIRSEELSPEETRLMFNAQLRLNIMKRAGKHLKNNEQDEFEVAMRELANQAPF